MTDRDIKYTASVDSNPFAAGMARVTSVLQGVSERFGATGRDWKATGEAMSGQMRQITDSVRSEVSAMGGHFGSLLGAIGNTKAGLVALVGAAAALAASKAVGATAKMTESTMDLARVLGSSTNAAQVWRIALQDVGASQEDLQGAARGMARQLKENEAEMNALGLVTRDAAGNLRPMNELLADGLQIMNDHKEGADRALAGQQLFGRGVDASSKLLLVNNETLQEATRTIGDLGLEVGANAVRAWKEYDAATDRAGFSVQGLVKTIGSILMPVLTDLINVFNAVMPAAITVVRGALGGLVTAFLAIKNGVVVVWETINAMVVTVAEPIRAVAEAIGRAITGDFAGAAAALKGITGVWQRTWDQAMGNMAESSRNTARKIAAIFNADTGVGEAVGDRGSKGARPPAARGKEPKATVPREAPDPSRMQEYELLLAEEKRLALEKDALREYTKQQEAEFWRGILAQSDVSAKDRIAISRKVAEIEIQILRDQAKLKQQLDQQELQSQQARALGAVEAAAMEARGRYELGEITNAQMLEQERLFEEQRTQIKVAALQARLAALQADPDKNPLLIAQIHAEIEELERQHRQRLRQIQLAEESIIRAPLQAVWQSAEQAMANAVDGMINRTMTLRQAMASIWGSIRATIIGEIAKIIAARVAAWAKERLLALAGIGANAAEAGSGAAKSVASIPYVGPILAIAALAAVMSAVMGAKSSVPSARFGFDIPAGVNPLTQLHEREMVLPAEQADVVRDLARDRGEDQAPVVLRGVSAGEFFVANKHELVRALKAARRDFQF